MGDSIRVYTAYMEGQRDGRWTFLVARIAQYWVGQLRVRWDRDPEAIRIAEKYPAAVQFIDLPMFSEFEVHPDWRSQGLGSRMLNFGEET